MFDGFVTADEIIISRATCFTLYPELGVFDNGLQTVGYIVACHKYLTGDIFWDLG